MLVSFFKILIKLKGFVYTNAHTHFTQFSRGIQFFHFERESFSVRISCISVSPYFIKDQTILTTFPLLHFFFFLPRRNENPACIVHIGSLSVSLRMDFHVAKMAVELFSRQCAIAALSLTAIVHLRWMCAVYYLAAHIQPTAIAIGHWPVAVHVFNSNIGLHAAHASRCGSVAERP